MFVGIDLGGTNTKIGFVDKHWKLAKVVSFPTMDFRKPISWVGRVVLELKSVKKVRGIGIGVPGAVDFEKGKILYLPNIPGWENVKIVSLFSKVLGNGIKVAVDNDATCMGFAEFVSGAARGYKNGVCLTFGTGVGGCLIINGEIYRGVDGCAGEIGHMPLVPWGRECSCAGKGCLERYVGNKELVMWAKKLGVLPKGKEELSIITMLARDGNKKAIEFWDRVAYTIAPTLIGVVNLLNPEIVVIGGGVAGAGKFLIDPLKRYVKGYSMKVQSKRVRLKLAKLGNRAGMLGAAYLVGQKKI